MQVVPWCSAYDSQLLSYARRLTLAAGSALFMSMHCVCCVLLSKHYFVWNSGTESPLPVPNTSITNPQAERKSVAHHGLGLSQ